MLNVLKNKIAQRNKEIPIVFINPPWFEGSAFDEVISKAPPLGLTYLAAVLEQDGFSNVRIIDMKAEEMNFEKLRDRIYEIKPSVLGITLATGQVNSAKRIIKMVKEKTDSKILCVIGGPHPSALPERTLEETNADICVFGEGEITMLEIANSLIEDKSLDPIEGIVFRENNLIRKNPSRPLINDLDSLPFPARHLLLPPKEYTKDSATSLTRIETVMMTSRGCPFSCAFCDKSVFGKTMRARSAKNIVDEIESLIKTYNIQSIRFFDDLFTVAKERVMEICREIKKRNIKIKWSCEARVNTVDPEILSTMKDAGCVEIHYGIESGNQKILDLQQKGITLEQVRKAIQWTNETDIASRGYFIIGLPGDTKETILETIKFGRSLRLNSAAIFFYTPYPGNFSRKYKLEDYGKVFAATWNDYISFENPIFIPNGMTKEELVGLYKRAYLEMHLNLKSIFEILSRIKSISTLKSYVRAFLWSIGIRL